MKRQAKSFLYMLKFIYLRKGCNENKCTQISYSFSHHFKFNHGHKKRKDSLKKRTVLELRLNLKYLGWPYRSCIETTKNGGFCEELLSENDFDAVLATFCFYDDDFNVSEAV